MGWGDLSQTLRPSKRQAVLLKAAVIHSFHKHVWGCGAAMLWGRHTPRRRRGLRPWEQGSWKQAEHSMDGLSQGSA